jgi:hypothetical protein
VTSIITLCIVIVTFVAFSVIISKAGFSRSWVLVPFTPLATWIATLIVAKMQLHTFVVFWNLAPFYPHTIELLIEVDEIAIFATWIFFLVFAFSRWPGATAPAIAPATEQTTAPATNEGPVPKSHGRRAVHNGADGATNSSPRPTARYPMPKGPGFGTLGFVAGPGAATHESTTNVATKPRGNQLATFCARCGESIPGNRALAHGCPNEGQPVKFCRYCGKSIPEGSGICPSCNQGA